MSISVGNDIYAKINKRLQKSDEEDYKTYENFIKKNPDLEKNITRILADHEDKEETWNKLMRLWKVGTSQQEEYDISYMYTRTIELAESYNHNQPKYSSIGFGKYAQKNKYTEMMRLRRLWKRLFFGIYPEIQTFLNRRSLRKEIISEQVQGSINWQKTILKSVNTGGVPLEFVCQIPEITLDLPENRLLSLAINWLHNDSEKLLQYTGYPEFLEEEKREVEKTFNISKRILEFNPLIEIQNKIEPLSRMEINDHRITKLVQQVKEKIDNGIILNKNYSELYNWINEYRFFNVDRFAGIPEGVRLDVETDLDTMYEYWILFELIAYLQNEKNIICKIHSENDIEIRNGIMKIKLSYNEKIFGTPVRPYVQPDYAIHTIKEIPFVMDAKNYILGDGSEGIGKAMRAAESYLVELNHKGVKDVVLFFPRDMGKKYCNSDNPYDEKHVTIEGLNYFCNDCQKISNGIENEDVCFYCKSENIEHKPTWHVHSCIINPSDKKEKQVMMRDNFGKIYEKLLKPHLE